jgi:hypothetical protein
LFQWRPPAAVEGVAVAAPDGSAFASAHNKNPPIPAGSVEIQKCWATAALFKSRSFNRCYSITAIQSPLFNHCHSITVPYSGFTAATANGAKSSKSGWFKTGLRHHRLASSQACVINAPTRDDPRQLMFTEAVIAGKCPYANASRGRSPQNRGRPSRSANAISPWRSASPRRKHWSSSSCIVPVPETAAAADDPSHSALRRRAEDGLA